MTFCIVDPGLDATSGSASDQAQTVLRERPVLGECVTGDLAEIPPYAVLQMLELGVNPEQVDERINALTDAELARLSTGIQDLPAGSGVIEVLGVVFLVFLILELVGVTNVFNKI